MATIITDVLSGKDAKVFVSNVAVKYTDNTLKDRIFATNDDTFLLITKVIGSTILINDVKIVDDALIESMLS